MTCTLSWVWFNYIFLCTRDCITARKLFSKMYCILNMLAMNCTASDSPSLIQIDWFFWIQFSFLPLQESSSLKPVPVPLSCSVRLSTVNQSEDLRIAQGLRTFTALSKDLSAIRYTPRSGPAVSDRTVFGPLMTL